MADGNSIMNLNAIRKACLSLGMVEPISIELDGTVWTGEDDSRVYADMEAVIAEVQRVESETQSAKQAILDRLGLTEDEAKVIFG
jgi:hypothetical protein